MCCETDKCFHALNINMHFAAVFATLQYTKIHFAYMSSFVSYH